MKKLLLCGTIFFSGCGHQIQTILEEEKKYYEKVTHEIVDETRLELREKVRAEMHRFRKKVRDSISKELKSLRNKPNEEAQDAGEKAAKEMVISMPAGIVAESDFLDKNPKAKSVRPELKLLLEYAYLHGWSYLVFEGHRSKERQLKLFNTGKSKVKFGQHNYSPSHAADLVPLRKGKLVWDDIRQLSYFAGYMKGLWIHLKDRHKWNSLCIRLGLDWDGDTDSSNQSFIDAYHLEIRDCTDKVFNR